MRNSAAVLVCALSLVVMSCGDKRAANNAVIPEDPATAARRREVLAELSTNVVLDALEIFRDDAKALKTATAALVASPEDAEANAAADSAWREAASSWQVVEAMQIGPIGAMGVTPGGADRRDEIYSWPLVNACRVDQELVENVFGDAEAFAIEPANVRGLDALEYLLFAPESGNQCAPNSAINTSGDWDALDAAELSARRAGYADTAAELVVGEAEALVVAWKDGFHAELANAGTESTLLPTTHEALNATSDALFYLDKEVKDLKLAVPIGLSDCDTATCPDARESRWANASLDHIRSNLAGFERLYTGGEGLGFDDLLTDVGAGDLARDMSAKIDAAKSAADAVSPDLVGALSSDPDALMALYDAIKALTDLLKTQFISVLDLEIPSRADGDND